MSYSEAGLERLARSVEFERLATALDAGEALMVEGQVDEAHEYLSEILESCQPESIFHDWLTLAIAKIMSKEALAVVAD